ncbi:MAG: PilZ domain-containing protein [Gemmataceae bacterium]
MDISGSILGIPFFAFWAGAVAAVGLGSFFARRWMTSRPNQGTDETPIITLDSQKEHHDRENSEFWEAPATKPDDRRNVPRREGNPTRVQMVGPDGRQRQHGLVLDRNSGGMRLAIERPLVSGSQLLLLAENAPQGTPWVKATVCWTKTDGKHHEVGVRFAEQVPWNILLLFG